MKQYTTPDQTAKLIEIGFEPELKIRIKHVGCSKVKTDYDYNFTIGELIELLPMAITHEIWFGNDKGKEGVWGLRIDTSGTEYGWDISYERPHSAHLYLEGRGELIDVLYDMCIKLKEEGAI